MRVMMRVSIDAIEGTKALEQGAMQKAISGFIEKFKPEAAYFTDHEGMRTFVMVFDMTQPHQMIAASEPFYALGGRAVISPCMVQSDLPTGLSEAGL